ncbi:hypothetical protein TCE0_015r01928 [Talaromyces pinophilus]|uniref:Amidase domain-containing protein n=1 Tax=Talaromyces pinophilus TaxID=128442 RepID=A0A6V8GZB5_TALPI|nr:hypothetical protein TCE0_015r01928 [Talaromyces pinophilus]
MDNPKTWEEIVSHKIKLRDQALHNYLVNDIDQRPPSVTNVEGRSRLASDPVVQKITDISSVPNLLKLLDEGKYTAEDVVRAYIKRAVVAHQLTNSITEVVFEDALKQARELDAHFKETGELKGPLHGIPVTLKDQFNIKGVDSTLGYVGRCFEPAAEDAVLVQILRNMGAVIVAKTNLPQSIMSHRLPYYGVAVSTEGQEHVPSSIGPMARDLETICYISRSLADSRPWDLDPRCSPLPWNETAFQEIQSRPMVIGLLVDDGVVKIHPPIERVLLALAEKLRAQGHEIVEWDTSDHLQYMQLMDRYYSADGFEDVIRDVTRAGEPFIPHVRSLISRGSAISVYQYWQLNKEKFELQKKHLSKWNSVRSPSGRPVDVLLSPVLPHTAVPHRALRWVGYTKVWNLLDYPAISFPIDEVRKGVDSIPDVPYSSRNPNDAWNWSQFDIDSMDGHPINLQVIGKRFEEEKVLGATTCIEKIWRAEN